LATFTEFILLLAIVDPGITFTVSVMEW